MQVLIVICVVFFLTILYYGSQIKDIISSNAVLNLFNILICFKIVNSISFMTNNTLVSWPSAGYILNYFHSLLVCYLEPPYFLSGC